MGFEVAAVAVGFVDATGDLVESMASAVVAMVSSLVEVAVSVLGFDSEQAESKSKAAGRSRSTAVRRDIIYRSDLGYKLRRGHLTPRPLSRREGEPDEGDT